MKLYNYWRSSASWRVRIALAHKGVAYTYVPIHIVNSEQHQLSYRERNPMQQVPTLEIDDGERTLEIGQSLAIIEYLEERFPKPHLLPEDRAGRARVRQLSEIINSGTQPFQNLPMLNYLKDELGTDPKQLAARMNERGLAAVEALSTSNQTRFLVGDAPTIADLCLVPQLYSARRFGVDVEAFPTLLRVEAACNELPAFIEAHPDRQPDAPKV
ncbi:MAG: maleylacetoacetate isomerase [Polyangia bacterium]